MNYFMRSKDKNNIQELVESNFDDDASDDDGHDDDDDSRSNLIEEELEDDLESIQSDDETVDEDNRCGTFLKQAWTKRSRALRTDIAIAGWMCSPAIQIMEDCNKNYDGYHKKAVTELLKCWFGHEVILLYRLRFLFFTAF